MKKNLICVLACSYLIAHALPASAQRMSRAADDFWQDTNAIAGMSKLGGALQETLKGSANWGDYCTASGNLARQGKFREAVRSASRALYLIEKINAVTRPHLPMPKRISPTPTAMLGI